VIVHQAYRFASDPTPAPARASSAHRGAARFAFSWGLALVKAVMDQRALGSLARAPANWSGFRTDKRAGRPTRFPRFKSNRRAGRTANQRRDRIHHRVAYLRRDGVQKLTTALANEFGSIVVEDLNVAGTRRHRRLVRAIADTGFAEIRRQLAYKTRWRGSCLVVADRWYPSSKTCSDRGVVKAGLPLHVRVFCCDSCGLRVDRDRNAARNLASLVARSTTGAGEAGDLEPQGSNGRRAAGSPTTCGLVAMKRPPRAERSDQTRTSRAGPFVTTA
jgi:putative transposase